MWLSVRTHCKCACACCCCLCTHGSVLREGCTDTAAAPAPADAVGLPPRTTSPSISAKNSGLPIMRAMRRKSADCMNKCSAGSLPDDAFSAALSHDCTSLRAGDGPSEPPDSSKCCRRACSAAGRSKNSPDDTSANRSSSLTAGCRASDRCTSAQVRGVACGGGDSAAAPASLMEHTSSTTPSTVRHSGWALMTSRMRVRLTAPASMVSTALTSRMRRIPSSSSTSSELASSSLYAPRPEGWSSCQYGA
mmetsp:Transcript_25699/g.64541  ORF Transcript_25699/g.64541 Transcript_25699/m.64541 type:complete len:249 (-) Transcript_25699:368-1114(-)